MAWASRPRCRSAWARPCSPPSSSPSSARSAPTPATPPQPARAAATFKGEDHVNQRKLCFLGASALVLAGLAAPAFAAADAAAPAAAPEAAGVEEVVVMAQKRAENI